MRSQCSSFQALLIVGKQSEQFNFGLEWEEEFWRSGLLFFLGRNKKHSFTNHGKRHSANRKCLCWIPGPGIYRALLGLVISPITDLNSPSTIRSRNANGRIRSIFIPILRF